MAETILAGKDLDERAEFLDAGDGTLIYLAGLGFRRDGVHLGLGHCHHVAGGGEDGNDAKVALFLDVDLGASLLADAANRLAALADERTDLVGGNLDHFHARSVLVELCTRSGNHALHVVDDLETRIVRGLDYYTKTVFEFVSDSIGAQSTVCGGGRYDGLIAELGGPAVQAVGFAMGLERLMMVAEAEGAQFPDKSTCDIYFAPMGKEAEITATKLCAALRAEGFEALTDINGRGLKAQMKYADKIGAKLNCVIGENELTSKKLVVKNMKTGDTYDVSLDNFTEDFYDIVNRIAFDDLSDTVL